MEERKERFKALQARAKSATESNRKETKLESQRLAVDPNVLSNLAHKQAAASHNLLKADIEAEGQDFERKRAWDWTVDESERWDRRMEKKARHRDDQAFQDYRQDSRKVYKRQMRELKPDLEKYEKQKMEAVERAAVSGGRELVETDDGEIVAVDKDGTFYSTADSTGFVENKPDKAAVDRLVNDLRKAEEVRLRKRRERGKGDDEGDVTYINEKNKQFNMKLARFYNKVSRMSRHNMHSSTNYNSIQQRLEIVSSVARWCEEGFLIEVLHSPRLCIYLDTNSFSLCSNSSRWINARRCLGRIGERSNLGAIE